MQANNPLAHVDLTSIKKRCIFGFSRYAAGTTEKFLRQTMAFYCLLELTPPYLPPPFFVHSPN
jgi:hypothetical protein